MNPATLLAVTACGCFFLTALLAGVWKWRSMITSPSHQAHFYVDTAHRAALLYSFACLVLAEFIKHSPFSDGVNLAATAAPIAFFAIAVGTYLWLGFIRKTENQFSRPSPVQNLGMILLILAEIGGFGVLFAGFILTRLM